MLLRHRNLKGRHMLLIHQTKEPRKARARYAAVAVLAVLLALTGGIAVDNSCFFKKLSGITCSAADPSNGDVYVTDPGSDIVDKFSASGLYLGQLQEASGSSPFHFKGVYEGLFGVSVDANGT